MKLGTGLFFYVMIIIVITLAMIITMFSTSTLTSDQLLYSEHTYRQDIYGKHCEVYIHGKWKPCEKVN